MKITEVKIKLISRSEDKLLAFASVTFERCFVVRDIKVIQGNKGLFVAMPSRKITDRCPKCSYKNHLQAKFCNQCGKRLPTGRSHMDGRGRAKLHADITHPINSTYRTLLQDAIVKGYKLEFEKSKKSNYAPPKGDDWDLSSTSPKAPTKKPQERTPTKEPTASVKMVSQREEKQEPPISAPDESQPCEPNTTSPESPPPPPPASSSPSDQDQDQDDGNGFGVFG